MTYLLLTGQSHCWKTKANITYCQTNEAYLSYLYF